MLSFTTFYLLRNPEAYHKAQQEVDTVVGKGPVRLEHLSHLPYLEAVFREALRLQPTAPGFSVRVHEKLEGPTLLAGKYSIPHGASITSVLPAIGRDSKVYGADANDFRPERMYKENFDKLPRNAWKASLSDQPCHSLLTTTAFRKWCKRVYRTSICIAGSAYRDGPGSSEF